MKRVSITGISGFLGTNLRTYLNGDFFVEELSLRSQQFNSNGADTIVHLAGKAHDLKKVSNPQEYYEVNYELTKRLFDSFINSNAEQFIFISSVKAVADFNRGALTEYDIPNPQSHYGKSKLLAERYIQSQELPKGKRYYILRPCMIHGPGNKGNLNLLFSFVKTKIPYPLAAFDNRRSYLSVNNICFVIKELIQRNNIPSGIYHVADDEPLSTNEVVSILSTSLNQKPNFLYIYPKFVRFIAKVGDKLKFPFNTERLHKLTDDYVVSNNKIKQVLEKELPLSAKEGLLLTAKSFEKNTNK